MTITEFSEQKFVREELPVGLRLLVDFLADPKRPGICDTEQKLHDKLQAEGWITVAAAMKIKPEIKYWLVSRDAGQFADHLDATGQEEELTDADWAYINYHAPSRLVSKAKIETAAE